jgi:hypothetical protein
MGSGMAWRADVAALAQSAEDALARGELEQASELIGHAFSRIERDGSEQDVVFIATALVAADFAARVGDIESAAALYKRAVGEGEALHRDAPQSKPDDVHALVGRGYLGLARADVERGYTTRAKERYELALRSMGLSHPPPPEDLLRLVRAELDALSPR